MNKYTLAITMVSAALLAQSNLRAQTYTDLYFNTVIDNPTCYLNTASNWYTDADRTTKFTGSVGANNNLNVIDSGVFTLKVNPKSSKLSVHDFNYKVNNITANNENLLVIASSKEFNIQGNMNLDLTTSTEGGCNLLMKTWYQGKVTVNGDMNVKSTTNGGWLVFHIGDADFQNSFTIDGNMSFQNKATRFVTGTANFKVGKVLDLHNGLWTMAGGYSTTSTFTRSVGGLIDSLPSVSATTGTRLEIAKQNSTTSLSFTNSGAYSYRGGFTSIDNTSIVNISMNALDAENGKQTLRFTHRDTYTYDSNTYFNDNNLNEVSVTSGTLELGMHSAMSATKISLDGAAATFSASGTDTNATIGSIKTGNLILSQGTLAIDFSKTACDNIVAENLTISNPSFLTLKLNITYEQLTTWLAEVENTSLDYKILDFGYLDNSGSLNDIAILKAEGIDVAIIENTDNLTLRLSAVPEAAEIAAILGALALSMAVWRKRK